MIDAGARRIATLEEIHVCSQFLYAEASFLDRGDLAAWVRLLAPDIIYWVPLLKDYRDPEDELNLVYDNLGKITDRLERLAGGSAFAQDPPSQTTRVIANVQAWRTDDGYRTESAFILHELRPEVTAMQTLAGRYVHVLRAEPNGDLRIARKTIELVNRTESFSNLTFVL